MNLETGCNSEHAHHAPANGESSPQTVLTLRSHSGLSGDMLLAGLAVLNLAKEELAPESPEADAWLSGIMAKIMPDFANVVKIRPRKVQGVSGWQAVIDLPHAHEHRNLNDVEQLIAGMDLRPAAKNTALACFRALAQCEASVHAVSVEEIHFHEVGALDSILDICGVCELHEQLGAPEIVCGPLPLADGQISCAHGILPAPAPAVLHMLKDVPVKPFAGNPQAGELVTPTSLALLKALRVNFGPWPSFQVEHTCLVYGQREFPGASNGVIFALGRRPCGDCGKLLVK